MASGASHSKLPQLRCRIGNGALVLRNVRVAQRKFSGKRPNSTRVEVSASRRQKVVVFVGEQLRRKEASFSGSLQFRPLCRDVSFQIAHLVMLLFPKVKIAEPARRVGGRGERREGEETRGDAFYQRRRRRSMILAIGASILSFKIESTIH